MHSCDTIDFGNCNRTFLSHHTISQKRADINPQYKVNTKKDRMFIQFLSNETKSDFRATLSVSGTKKVLIQFSHSTLNYRDIIFRVTFFGSLFSCHFDAILFVCRMSKDFIVSLDEFTFGQHCCVQQ